MEMQEKRKKFYNMTDEWLQCAHFLDTYSTCRIEYVKMKYTAKCRKNNSNSYFIKYNKKSI